MGLEYNCREHRFRPIIRKAVEIQHYRMRPDNQRAQSKLPHNALILAALFVVALLS